MVDLIILLLIGLISGLVFLGKWLIVAIAAPFYYGGEAIWNHSQSGVANKIKNMSDDDFVALICDILKKKGFSNVRRDRKDMNIVLAEKNGRHLMCACLGGSSGQITANTVNLVMRKAEAYKIKKYVICYSISITSAAISFARENKVNLANEYVIAGSLIYAKRQSR